MKWVLVGGRKAKDYSRILSVQKRLGYLTSGLSAKRNKLDKSLMSELRKKSPKEFEDVQRVL